MIVKHFKRNIHTSFELSAVLFQEFLMVEFTTSTLIDLDEYLYRARSSDSSLPFQKKPFLHHYLQS